MCVYIYIYIYIYDFDNSVIFFIKYHTDIQNTLKQQFLKELKKQTQN